MRESKIYLDDNARFILTTEMDAEEYKMIRELREKNDMSTSSVLHTALKKMYEEELGVSKEIHKKAPLPDRKPEGMSDERYEEIKKVAKMSPDEIAEYCKEHPEFKEIIAPRDPFEHMPKSFRLNDPKNFEEWIKYLASFA